MTCKVAGCRSTKKGARGYCNAHYLRLRRRGTVEPARVPIPDRFWSKVDERGPGECWPWSSALNNNGYGRFTLSWSPETRVLAHRFAYILTTGEDVRGRVLMHTCDNPPCVNPAHLVTGTQADNVRDMHAKGRGNLSGLAIGQYTSTQLLRAGIDRTQTARERARTA